jgi:hypothetical protein
MRNNEKLFAKYAELAGSYGFGLTREGDGEFISKPCCLLKRRDIPFVVRFYPGSVDIGTDFTAVIDFEAEKHMQDWDNLAATVASLDKLHKKLKERFESYEDKDVGLIALFYEVPARHPVDFVGLEEFIKIIAEHKKG